MEKKTITILIGVKESILKDLKEGGWRVAGFGFSPKGGEYSEMYLERKAVKAKKPVVKARK